MDKVQQIKAEIERRIKSLTSEYYELDKYEVRKDANETKLKINEYKSLLSFINLFPEDTPSDGLEKVAEKYFEQYNYMPKGFVVDAFKAGAEWQKEQMMTKILELLNTNGAKYIEFSFDKEWLIRDLKRMMED